MRGPEAQVHKDTLRGMRRQMKMSGSVWSTLWLLVLFAGCWAGNDREVVVYVALDREFSEPVLRDFEQRTGIKILAKYDVESTKTVGLVNAIIQERGRPRCDLFWNNEVLHTLRLRQMGLLEPAAAAGQRDWPANYRGAAGEWFGLAARARVLIVNTERVPADRRPKQIEDLIDPQWRGQVGVAKPLFGTTATHAAVLFASWGPERAQKFFRDLRANAQVLSGNKQVATAVGRGQLAFGLTDTDDAIIEREQGRPVEIIFPNQADMGTLFIPNSVALVRGGPNRTSAEQLLSYLLQPQVEERLAAGESAQFPVNPQVRATSRAAPDQPIQWQSVDFEQAASVWETAATWLRDEFSQ